MKNVKRFQEGGFTKEQEEWLGGADRTDPYILARMRKAVPDAPKAAAKMDDGELRDETGAVSKIRRNTETGDLYNTESSPKPASVTVTEIKKVTPVKKETADSETPKVEKKAETKKASSGEPSFFKGTKGYKNVGELFKSMRQSAGITGYKSGGSVKSSASKRGDGCAVRGKTKGRMV
jgi:hypothetical protein